MPTPRRKGRRVDTEVTYGPVDGRASSVDWSGVVAATRVAPPPRNAPEVAAMSTPTRTAAHTPAVKGAQRLPRLSTVTAKLVMAVTGTVFALFVVVHMVG